MVARWYQKSNLFIICCLLGAVGLLPFVSLWLVLNSTASFGRNDVTPEPVGMHDEKTMHNHVAISSYVGHNSTNITKLSHDDGEKSLLLQPIRNRTIMLVHVGKTGGSTLIRYFNQKYWQPGNVLQRTTVLYPICHMHTCYNTTLSKATTLLFVVRNPIDRLISAYKFSHPDNCITFKMSLRMNVPPNDIWGCHMPLAAKEFYRTCAPTLEDLANVPFEKNSSNAAELCRQSIRGIMKGGDERFRKQSTHAYFNYNHYKNVTMERYANGTINSSWNREIFVIRTEHLWKDASSLDVLMNGTGNFNIPNNVTHGSENYQKYTSTISQRGYERLCCMLIDEINVFEDIVSKAENLSRKEKNDTIREVERRCGILLFASRVAWASSCQDQFV